jgi:D-serine deaminase-like pyridoxal phosphate-dependent protein
MMHPLDDLPTPSLLLDIDRLEANGERMRQRACQAGVRLRPHLKTLKSVDAARRVVDAGGAITVSTLTEAAHFAGHGFRDIVCAVCLPADKAARAAQVHRSIDGPGLATLVDSLPVAQAMADRLRTLDAVLPLWIEVDCGEHRTGVDPDGDELLALGRFLAGCPQTELRGVLTHGGQSYRCRDAEAVRAVAAQERDAVVHAAQRLRAAGIDCPGVSAGSTPTAVHGTDWTGVTELRPGVYMAGDLFQIQMRSLAREDLAVSVLASVISVKPGRAVIDAGGLALSKDRSLMGLPDDPGFGALSDLDGRPLGLQVAGVHQEHGEVPLPPGAPALQPGQRVRVWPVHVCMTAAAHGHYHVLRDGRPVGTWPRVNGWD